MSEMNKTAQSQAKPTVEVLITTMNCQEPSELLRQMNIQGAAMIGNQVTNDYALRDCVSNTPYQDRSVPMYSFHERA